MRLGDYIAADRVISLRSTRKEEALEELASALSASAPAIRKEALLEALAVREATMSSWIGSGCALPHVHIPGASVPMIAIGRSRRGVEYYGWTGQEERAHLVFLLVTDPNDEQIHLQIMRRIALLLKDEGRRRKIIEARSPRGVLRVLEALELDERAAPAELGPLSRVILAHAREVAAEVGARAILVFLDAIQHPDVLERLALPPEAILVIRSRTILLPPARKSRIVQIPDVRLNRIGLIRMGVFFALSRGLVKGGDRIVCVSGMPECECLDSMVVLDLDREYEPVLARRREVARTDVQPEVLERVIAIACEIAVEGREGKPLGTIFVVGDSDRVLGHTKQLILNPFSGYPEDALNILDPSLAETVKEFAAIDGAFIVRGDGVLLSAGAYLRTDRAAENLPGGLGARHQAAASISTVTRAFGVAVSQSTGAVTVFKEGGIFMAIERPARAEPERF